MFLRLRAALAAMVCVLLAGSAQAASAPAQDIPQEYVALEQSLQPRHGSIALSEAEVTLDLGDKYDFYSGPDVEKILVQLWGNPPGAAEGVLGIVMPAGASPLSEAWGALVSFQADGYVDDDDAAEVDYDELLQQLKDDTESANAERESAGYPPLQVMGWAEHPKYDQATHSVVWARDLKVGTEPIDALNYDVRTLGRKGVLSINFLSSMPDLPSIRAAASDFAGHAAFDQGSRYEDYQDGDKVAEYGIGGLVAAGIGIAVAQKLGLLAIILKFGKFIIIGVGLALAAGRKYIARLFGRTPREEEYQNWESETADPAPAERGDLKGNDTRTPPTG